MATPAIRLSIELKADPELMETLRLLAAGLSGLGLRIVAPEEPVAPVAPPAVEAPPAPKLKAVKLEDGTVPPPPAPPSVLDFDDAKAALAHLVETKGRDAAVALLGTFGVPSLKALPAGHYAAFIAKARA